MQQCDQRRPGALKFRQEQPTATTATDRLSAARGGRTKRSAARSSQVCREKPQPTARSLRGRRNSEDTLESCAFEGESLFGCIYDLRSESNERAAQCRECTVDRARGAVRGTVSGRLPHRRAHEFRLLRPVSRGSSALHAIELVRVSPTSPQSFRRILTPQ